MRNRTALPGEINHNLVDRYTIGHFAVGTLLGLGKFPWWAALGVAVGWELIENPMKDMLPKVFPISTHDTFANAVGDAAFMMAGYFLIKMLPEPNGPHI